MVSLVSYSRPSLMCLNSVLNMKAVVAAFNQEKALVGAFSVITNLWMELFEALVSTLVRNIFGAKLTILSSINCRLSYTYNKNSFGGEQCYYISCPQVIKKNRIFLGKWGSNNFLSTRIVKVYRYMFLFLYKSVT